MRELKEIVSNAKRTVENNSELILNNTNNNTNNNSPVVPRVQETPSISLPPTDQRVTRSMAQQFQQQMHDVPRVEMKQPTSASLTPILRRRKRIHDQPKPKSVNQDQPANNTRSKTTAREEKAKPPAANTRTKTKRKRVSRLMQPTKSSMRKEISTQMSLWYSKSKKLNNICNNPH